VEVENVKRTFCQLFLHLQRMKMYSDPRDENMFVEYVLLALVACVGPKES
jgi:hypothetical protein